MRFIEVHSIILIVIGSLELLLAIYFFATHSGSRVRLLYAFFILGVTLWVLGLGLEQSLYLKGIQNEILSRTPYFGAMVISASLLLFISQFPFASRKIGLPQLGVVLVAPIVMVALLFFTNFILTKEIFFNEQWGLTHLYGKYVFIFNTIFLSYWIFGCIELGRKFTRSQGPLRWILKYFIIAIALSSIIGVTTNIIIPSAAGNESLWWLGPEASTVLLAMTTYIITKQG